MGFLIVKFKYNCLGKVFFILLSINFSIGSYYSYLDLIIYTFLTLVPLLLVIAIFTLSERRVMASVQRRKGPNVVGIWGFLQPFADGLKLVVKEMIIPNKVNKFLFIFSPGLVLFLSFIGWVSIPFDLYTQILSLNYSLLYMLVISSLGVYGILLSGWSSNSKFALLGSLRSVAQMISYEVAMCLCVIPVVLCSGSLNINIILCAQMKTVWFVLPLLPLAIIHFISILAETNRAPFDLAEAEAELVAGYNVEYSSIAFAAFFLGEYSNILFMSSVFVCLFFGGPDSGLNLNLFSINIILLQEFCLSFKIVITAALFIFVRANLPRLRFDQLMFIGWKIFLPISFGFIIFFSGLLFTFSSLEIIQLQRIGCGFNSIESLSVDF